MPAIAPPLRPLFVLPACPPCCGGNMLAVVMVTAAEPSIFDERGSFVIGDEIVVEGYSRLI